MQNVHDSVLSSMLSASRSTAGTGRRSQPHNQLQQQTYDRVWEDRTTMNDNDEMSVGFQSYCGSSSRQHVPDTVYLHSVTASKTLFVC